MLYGRFKGADRVKLIILLAAIQIASNKPATIEANPLCANVPYTVYNIDNEVICLPTDVISRRGFE